jgi:hypothetical protein
MRWLERGLYRRTSAWAVASPAETALLRLSSCDEHGLEPLSARSLRKR